MKSFIYPEMMVHVPLCTNKNPEKILLISDDAKSLENEVKKHDAIQADTISCSLNALRDIEDNTYDVVVSELSNDAAELAHLNRILAEDGQLVIVHPSLDKIDENKSLMQILGKYFKIIMPYRLEDGTTLLLNSKEYHPTADIILHRADMLDDLEYYNCDVHVASFAMPNYIRKEYLGVIKN